MARDEDEAVGEALLRIPDIPAHGPRKHSAHHRMDLGAGAPWMAALPVVQDEIDQLITDFNQQVGVRQADSD